MKNNQGSARILILRVAFIYIIALILVSSLLVFFGVLRTHTVASAYGDPGLNPGDCVNIEPWDDYSQENIESTKVDCTSQDARSLIVSYASAVKRETDTLGCSRAHDTCLFRQSSKSGLYEVQGVPRLGRCSLGLVDDKNNVIGVTIGDCNRLSNVSVNNVGEFGYVPDNRTLKSVKVATIVKLDSSSDECKQLATNEKKAWLISPNYTVDGQNTMVCSLG